MTLIGENSSHLVVGQFESEMRWFENAGYVRAVTQAIFEALPMGKPNLPLIGGSRDLQAQRVVL